MCVPGYYPVDELCSEATFHFWENFLVSFAVLLLSNKRGTPSLPLSSLFPFLSSSSGSNCKRWTSAEHIFTGLLQCFHLITHWGTHTGTVNNRFSARQLHPTHTHARTHAHTHAHAHTHTHTHTHTLHPLTQPIRLTDSTHSVSLTQIPPTQTPPTQTPPTQTPPIRLHPLRHSAITRAHDVTSFIVIVMS